ncbi:MAG: hypothetical protein LBT38_10190 [Deltaproteobacteria bacterium]|nr:hypothetical protein [Deltaproteobacteria bacterium]
MLKKLTMALFLGAFAFAFAAASLTAQIADITITDKEIDLYIKYATAGSPEAQAKVAQASDPATFASAVGKIQTYVALKATGQPDNIITQALASAPFKYSDAEVALIKSKEADLLAAYKKLTGQP